MASCCAFLAMVHLMIGALIATSLAYVSTNFTDGFGKFATTGHVACGEPAYLCTVHVGCYTPRHHLDVLLLQARGGTKITGVGTGVAGFDTRRKLLIRHCFLHSMVREGSFFSSVAGTPSYGLFMRGRPWPRFAVGTKSQMENLLHSISRMSLIWLVCT